MKIYIGTSGYSFPDWKGTFYPENLPDNKYFLYYADHFSTAEINYTYYTFPKVKTFHKLNNESHSNFNFIIKSNNIFTHKQKYNKEDIEKFMEPLNILIENNKFEGVLFQFPESFYYNNCSFDYLKKLTVDFLSYVSDRHIIIEFRNNNWINPVVRNWMKDNKLTISSIDEPKISKLPGTMYLQTNKTFYLRLHSRNEKIWYNHGQLRYNYLYKTNELLQWVKIITNNKSSIEKAFIFFNNCHAGHAARNAMEMIELLKNINF